MSWLKKKKHHFSTLAYTMFFFFNGTSTFIGYLLPNSSLQKNISDII